MADIVITPASVDASPDAIIERGTLGEAANAGEILYLFGAEDWRKADADALASAQGRAVLLGSGVLGTAYPAGAQVDLVLYGRMTWGAGMTPGGKVYVSTTAGAGDQTAPAASGDYPFSIGWAWSATELFVNPQTATPTVNP